jgi:MscS family membrane protein
VPVSVIVAAWGVHELVEGPLNLTGNVLEAVLHGTEALMFLGSAWAVVSFSGVVAEIIITSPRISEKGLDANLLRFGSRLLGLVIAVLIIVTGRAWVSVAWRLRWPLSRLWRTSLRASRSISISP